LYKFVGFRLAEGENPFNINFEIPPLGKWLYGLSEKYLGNPYWVSSLMYLTSAWLVYQLARKVIKEKWVALPTTLLYVSTPFVASQIKETMLDLPLMFFYLWHMWWFWLFLEKRKWRHLILAGVFLGLATGVKPAVYTPLIGLIGLVTVLLSSKKLMNGVWYTGSVIVGYLGAWFCYFIRHPNPIPWLRLHEKSITFYLGQGSDVDYLNQWRTIFMNSYRGWWMSGSGTRLDDWSIILPLGILVLLTVVIKALKNKDWRFVYLGAVVMAFLGINTIIPFWPRYLMPAIPLLVVILGYSFQKKRLILGLLIAFSLPVLFNSINHNSVTGDAQAVARFISTRAYRELYRSVNYQQRKTIDEKEFVALNERLIRELGVKYVEVKIVDTKQDKNDVVVRMDISYDTRYGTVTVSPEMTFVRLLGQWRLRWSDEYLLPGYSKESQIVINAKTIPFLKMVDSFGSEVAKRDRWYEVYVIPRLMFEWTKHLDQLALITGDPSMTIDGRIKRVIPDDLPVFVGYLNVKLGQAGIEKALAIKGVSVKEIDYPLLDFKYEKYIDLIPTIEKLKTNQTYLFIVEASGKVINQYGKEYPIPFPVPESKDVVIKL
jgi:hypothetical protein